MPGAPASLPAIASAEAGGTAHGPVSTPFVRVSNLKRTLNVCYQTAQSDIDRLVKAKILKLLPGIHPKCYFSEEIYSIAYAEQDGEQPAS
jgi:hypothetical protein